jgi:hypothetical protein
LTLYFTIAAVAFLFATTGSDIYARTTIGGQQLGPAVSEHLYWAGVQFIATMLLFLPFGFLAAIGSWIEDNTNRWKALLIFGLPALYLIYAYFEGYQASKVAELDKRWTAATLDVAFLPFGAVPVVLLAWLIGYVAVRGQRKMRDTGSVEKD